MLEIKRMTTVPTSWVEIKEAAKNGMLHELLTLGDELPITLKTGEEVTLQLADMTMGDRPVEGVMNAPSTQPAGICRPCFVLKDCMKDEKPMNKRATNEGGWGKSFMREWLNGTVFHMLPDELQEIIVPRAIRQKLGEETVETQDKLWLPSCTEMFGAECARDWAPEDDEDEQQLQLYKTEHSRVKECGDEGTWWYWLRSPSGSNSTHFYYVTSNGTADYYNASTSIGVAFGFCL